MHFLKSCNWLMMEAQLGCKFLADPCNILPHFIQPWACAARNPWTVKAGWSLAMDRASECFHTPYSWDLLLPACLCARVLSTACSAAEVEKQNAGAARFTGPFTHQVILCCLRPQNRTVSMIPNGFPKGLQVPMMYYEISKRNYTEQLCHRLHMVASWGDSVAALSQVQFVKLTF